MILSWKPEYWLVVLAALYLVYSLSRSDWIWRWRGEKYTNALIRLAEQTSLKFSPGSFSPGMAKIPIVKGNYRGRQITVSADTRGKWGFRDAVLKIMLSIDNQPTPDMPRGAFFVVGDPGRKGLFSLFQSKEDSEGKNKDLRSFPMKCVPKNLGNYLLSLQSVNILLSKPQINDLLISEGSLLYRQVGLEKDTDNILNIIIQLCDMADKFERFNRNWIN